MGGTVLVAWCGRGGVSGSRTGKGAIHGKRRRRWRARRWCTAGLGLEAHLLLSRSSLPIPNNVFLISSGFFSMKKEGRKKLKKKTPIGPSLPKVFLMPQLC
ncbi:hypothetical protein U1Q18_006972 [Sarracenia purpurea var. burkii]